MDAIPNQTKKKNTSPFYIVFQVLRVHFIKIYKIKDTTTHVET